MNSTLPADVSPSLAIYHDRRDAANYELTTATRRWNLIGNVRLALFVALAVLVGGALIRRDTWAWVGAAVVAMALVVIVAWHARLRRRRDELAAMVSVNTLALARLNLEWDSLPPAPIAAPARNHPYAKDLDVVGHGSLMQRVSTPVLHHGWQTLSTWLLTPAAPSEIEGRQAAVRELAPQLDRRQTLEAMGRTPEGSPPDPAPFLAWAGEPDHLLARPWLWIVAIASPLALVVLLLVWLTGTVAVPLWLVPIIVNVALFQLVGGRISAEVEHATSARAAIRGYTTIFDLIASAEADSALLRSIAQRLGTDGAAGQMRRFSGLASWAIPRSSILYLPIQMATLWDVHLLHALERWRRHVRGQVPAWFEAAGEWEALAALSVLAHDHPTWAFPVVDSTATSIEAKGMTHPLIDPADAVANDVTVGPEGTFLYVTGSNMSGKSTLLRAIGANAVLAQAGAPVAAAEFRMPSLDVWTCMRVEDSLERGVSFFMAELERLKAVVDAAGTATERQVLYLLDEILQGTNTAERQIASRQVIAQLCRSHAIGAVSSHDLELVDDRTLANQAVAMHFADQVRDDGDGPVMTFDYRLQPCVATSTNALALMRILGFDVQPDRG